MDSSIQDPTAWIESPSIPTLGRVCRWFLDVSALLGVPKGTLLYTAVFCGLSEVRGTWEANRCFLRVGAWVGVGWILYSQDVLGLLIQALVG